MSAGETGYQAVSTRCPYCGGSAIISSLTLNQGIEVGSFGIRYKAAAIFTATEPLHVDLCQSCGSVVRFFVKDVNRRWIQR